MMTQQTQRRREGTERPLEGSGALRLNAGGGGHTPLPASACRPLNMSDGIFTWGRANVAPLPWFSSDRCVAGEGRSWGPGAHAARHLTHQANATCDDGDGGGDGDQV